MQVGLQPHTIGTLEEPLPDKLARTERARYQGIELGAGHVDEVRESLATGGLAVSSIGTGTAALSEDLDAHLHASRIYGTKDVVIMWLEEERFTSAAAIAETADELDGLADELGDHGLTLHYHNHDHEWVTVDGQPALARLYDETDRLRFELDLGWAGAGGVDPAATLERMGERVTHVHLKDMDFAERAFVTFGEGDLDIDGALRAAEDVGVEWVLFENDDPIDPIAEISHASLLLDAHLGHISG